MDRRLPPYDPDDDSTKTPERGYGEIIKGAGVQPDPRIRELIDDAAEASEMLGDDALERHAAELEQAKRLGYLPGEDGPVHEWLIEYAANEAQNRWERVPSYLPGESGPKGPDEPPGFEVDPELLATWKAVRDAVDSDEETNAINRALDERHAAYHEDPMVSVPRSVVIKLVTWTETFLRDGDGSQEAADIVIDVEMFAKEATDLDILSQLNAVLGIEVEPRCDICGEPEDHDVGMIPNDWNGETGNHLSCERDNPG